MADNDVQVTVGADTSDFQAGMSEAAQVSQNSFGQITMNAAAARNMLGQMGSTPTAQLGRLNQMLAGTASASRGAASEISGIAGAAASTTAAGAEMGNSLVNIGLTASQAAMGARALFDELSSGRYRQAGGTFARLLTEIGMANPLFATAAAGAIAFGAALAGIVIHGVEAQEAIEGVNRAMVLTGQGAQFNEAQTRSMIEALSQLPDVSEKSAGQVAQVIARIPVAADGTRQALGQISVALAKLTDTEPQKAAEALARAFSGGAESLQAFGREFGLFTAEQQEGLDKAKAMNDTLGAQAIALQALTDRALKPYLQYVDQLAQYRQAIAVAGSDAMGDNPAVSLQAPDVPRIGPGTPAEDPATSQRLQSAYKYLETANQIKAVEQDIANIQKDQAAATTDQQRAEFGTALKAAQQKLQSLQAPSSADNKRAEELRRQLQQEQDLQAEFDRKDDQQWEEQDQQQIDATKDAGTRKIAQLEDDAQTQLAIGKITQQQELATLRDTENQRYQINLDSLNDTKKLLQQYGQDTIQIDRQIEQEKNRHELALTKLTNQGIVARNKADQAAAKSQEQTWRSVLGPFDNAISQMTNGVLQGTQSWKQAWASAGSSLVVSMAQAGEQMVENFIVNLALGLAAQKTAGQESVMIDAKKAFAGAYSSASSIPYIGWILGPIAGAAAFAAVMATSSFAVGSPYVPSDMTAQIHQGEIIVPRTFSDGVRSGDLTIGGPGSSSAALPMPTGGDTHVHFHNPTFNGDLSRPASARTGRQLMKDFNKALRDNPSLRPA